MKFSSLRLPAFLLLFTFSSQQIISAFPVVRPISSSPMTQKLHSLNSQSQFENYLKADYAKDSSGLSEHQRRRGVLQGVINSVYESLRIYFGFSSGTLDSKLESLLKLLKSDPAFEMKEFTPAELDQIKARLLGLVEEDIHFGQSAVEALAAVIARSEATKQSLDPEIASALLGTSPRNDKTRAFLRDLTLLALFSDILTGVLSPEFAGNLQFSAYTLKQIAESYGMKLTGLKLTWEELKSLVQSNLPVLATIEDRHFVVVTAISSQSSADSCELKADSCLVTFLENGFTRIKPVSEFQPRWFGEEKVPGTVRGDR